MAKQKDAIRTKTTYIFNLVSMGDGNKTTQPQSACRVQAALVID